MIFTIRATQSGKTIRVVDTVAGVEAFNNYLDLGAVANLNVGSTDGETGLVDIWYAVTGPANTIWGSNPNTVNAGQTLDIDGQ